MTPRVVLAAPNSSSGKTTISIGLMAALRARGLQVAGFKVGPDYIDPGYHALATGRPGRNLDAWLCGPERIAPLLAHGALGCDVSVVEGVMGLFDGRLGVTDGIRGFGSTAHIARLIDAPVVLVVDATGVSRTLAASALGLATHPDAPRIGGVIINKAGSSRASDELRDAFDQVGLPLLGVVPRSPGVIVASRHLGLVPAAESDQARQVVDAAAALVAAHVDLAAVLTLARQSAPLAAAPWNPASEVISVVGVQPRIAVAAGRAFTFRYAETTELLRAAGCETVEFDPLTAPGLPAGTHALYLGGGFPEVFAAELASNRPLLTDVRAAVASGLPTVAECAGLLYLCRSLDGADLAGVLPLDARLGGRLTLGYHTLTAERDSLLARAGETFHSHEFHKTHLTAFAGRPGPQPAWLVDLGPAQREGYASPSLCASYQHVHWAGTPIHAQRFAEAAADYARAGHQWTPPACARPIPVPDLRHHGDVDVRPGMVDLAVNVRPAPRWLLDAVTSEPQRWAAYPDAGPARHALADRHGLDERQLLPCAGAAEAFTLIARTFPNRRAVIVHPQFTEPELAWRTAGHQVSRHLLRAAEAFRLDASLVPADADLVVIGNPTNPTGVLHSAAQLRRLLRPGRIVVVDEAFMDFVPREAESMIGGAMAGLLVTRSLTKLWGIAGLRAGFIAGDASLIAKLAAVQEPWATSTPALDAMVAVCSEQGSRHAADLAAHVETERQVLVDALRAEGFPVVGDPQTPFVLVDISPLGPIDAPSLLAEAGFAVRRCDTFPGLGPDWVRLAVRDESTSRGIAAALAGLRVD